MHSAPSSCVLLCNKNRALLVNQSHLETTAPCMQTILGVLCRKLSKHYPCKTAPTATRHFSGKAIPGKSEPRRILIAITAYRQNARLRARATQYCTQYIKPRQATASASHVRLDTASNYFGRCLDSRTPPTPAKKAALSNLLERLCGNGFLRINILLQPLSAIARLGNDALLLMNCITGIPNPLVLLVDLCSGAFVKW